MKVRFIAEGGDFGDNPSYLDVEMEQAPMVGDEVHLPDDFYRYASKVKHRSWFLGVDRQADVLITVQT